MTVFDVLAGEARSELHRGEALAFLRTLPDESVDAVITDPPYSTGGAFRADRAAQPRRKYVAASVQHVHPDFVGDSRDGRSFGYWSTMWISECFRVAKAGAPICIFSDWRQLPTITDALQAGGWVWRGIAVWDKTEAARPVAGRFRNQCEYVVWGSKGPMPVDHDSGVVLPGCFRHSVKPTDKHHLSGKPTELMHNIVKIAPAGGIILDPFAGSGTTGVAAIRGGRRFLGTEMTEYYHAVAVARLRVAETTPDACG